MKKGTTVEEIVGPWEDPDFESGLIKRCRDAWQKELKELTNEEVSTFLRQKIAVEELTPIAKERIQSGIEDGTESWDDELQQALDYATEGSIQSR
jgi:hypothetical protein